MTVRVFDTMGLAVERLRAEFPEVEFVDASGSTPGPEVEAEVLFGGWDDAKVVPLLERGVRTMQPTALVNEAYLKLVQIKSSTWQDRAHFFAVASQIMRRILVDHARLHIAGKRGGGLEALPLNEALVFCVEKSNQLVNLDDALKLLEAKDPRASQVIELRFFGGLSVEESAEVLKISARTVRREWTFARVSSFNRSGSRS